MDEKSRTFFDARALANMRISCNVSVGDLAHLCDIGKTQMSACLLTGVMPTHHLRAVCEVLGADYEQIIHVHTTIAPGEISLTKRTRMSKAALHPITLARQQRGWSQRMLAEKLPSLEHLRLSSAQRALSYYENGKAVPDAVAKDLRWILGVETAPPEAHAKPCQAPKLHSSSSQSYPAIRPLDPVASLPQPASGIAGKDAALNRMLHAASRNPELLISDFLRDEYRDQYVSMLEERCTFLQSQVWNGKT